MKKSQTIEIVGICFIALISSKTFAHHGWRGYTIDFSMTANVVDVNFGNPHDRIVVNDKEGQQWNFLLAPPPINRRFGYDQTVVKIGDTVDLIGQHSKTVNEGKVHVIENEIDEIIDTYYYNSGQTSLER